MSWGRVEGEMEREGRGEAGRMQRKTMMARRPRQRDGGGRGGLRQSGTYSMAALGVSLMCLCVRSEARFLWQKDIQQIQSQAAKLQFAAIGDWGGKSGKPYTTKDQLAVATAMGTTAASESWSFVLALGDNFYDQGVETGTSGFHSWRFWSTFEKVYKAPSLAKLPWYVIAGNHDHYGSVPAQLRYALYNPRWRYPHNYYSFTYDIPGTRAMVQVVMLDTVLLVDKAPADTEEQLDWLESTLSSSTAEWVIVSGHYPIWSVAEHGPTSLLVEKLLPILERHRVALYLCGHDHQLQHLRADASSVDLVVSGAGHSHDSNESHMKDVPEGALKMLYNQEAGFVVVDVEMEQLTVRYIKADGDAFYSFSKTNPRSSW